MRNKWERIRRHWPNTYTIEIEKRSKKPKINETEEKLTRQQHKRMKQQAQHPKRIKLFGEISYQ